jgi:hypothetical protein
MPELATLRHVADLIVDRVLAETKNVGDLGSALENAYPFAEHPEGRRVWVDALLRHALELPPRPKPTEAAADRFSNWNL